MDNIGQSEVKEGTVEGTKYPGQWSVFNRVAGVCVGSPLLLFSP